MGLKTKPKINENDVKSLMKGASIHASQRHSNSNKLNNQRNGSNIILIDLDDIEDHPNNIDIYGIVNTDDIDQSIAEEGLHQAIVVCEGDVKPYRVLAGHRRLASFRKASVQEQYHIIHGKELTSIPATNKGTLSDTEQMSILLSTNVYRPKTFIMRVREAQADKDNISQRMVQRKKSGTKVEEKIITNEVVGKKYFGVGKDYMAIIFKIYEAIKDDPKHPLHDYLDNASRDGLKIKWREIYEKVSSPQKDRARRVDKGKSKVDPMAFFPKLKNIGFDLGKISTVEEAEQAELCLSKLYRESKKLRKSLVK
jgi:hypothetical protein